MVYSEIVMVLPWPGSVWNINDLVTLNCSVRVVSGKLNRIFLTGDDWLLGVIGGSPSPSEKKHRLSWGEGDYSMDCATLVI